MNETTFQSVARPNLTGSGISRLITVIAGPGATAAVFISVAGTLDVPHAWIYHGGLLSSVVASMIVLFAGFTAVVKLILSRFFMES